MLKTLDIIDILVNELEDEGKITRKMLERVPTDKFSWQPHTKSMTMKQLATHVAELPGWITMGLNTEELDFAASPYKQDDFKSTEELLAFFDKNQAEAKQQLAAATEEQMLQTWTLREGDVIYQTFTKEGVVRHALSQTIHHRAQLGVYFRLLDISVPATYGPSADEQ